MTNEFHDDAVARLTEQVQRLSDEVERLKAERPGPSAAAAPATLESGAVDPGGALDAVTDRRRMLKRAGVAAAGAVAGAGVLATQTGTAFAANGDSLKIGNNDQTTNVGTEPTVLRVSGSNIAGKGGLQVQDSASNQLFLFGGAMVSGVATSGSDAVYGVAGRAFGANAVASGIFWGTGTGVIAAGSDAAIRLQALHGPPLTTSGNHIRGELEVDTNGDLWVCYSSGTPGSWRRVSGANTAGALTLLASPVRVYDSRPGNPPNTPPKTPLSNSNRDIDAKNNSSGVPTHATAILANFTVVNTSASGFLAAYKAGIPFPGTSTINWNSPNSIVANTTVVAIDSSQKFRCLVPASSSTDFFVDVIGYFA